MSSKRRTSAKGRGNSGKPTPRPRVARPGDNTLEGRATPYLKRIEGKLDALDSERGIYMAKCKALREHIKEIYGEAKDHGVAVKALKGLVEYRVLEKKQAKIADGLDIDEQAAYAQLVASLGPLGMAAARAAGFLPDAERDVRPRHMTQPDAQAETPPASAEASPIERADEDALARVGRGPADQADQITH